jgi:DNA-binding response OmpR family regulator
MIGYDIRLWKEKWSGIKSRILFQQWGSQGWQKKMRVLIIEDEIKLARNIAKVLEESASFVTDISSDGEDGRHMALSNSYDLIILDLMLPKIPGLKILQGLRQKGHRTPVLILTARDATEDVIQGLDLGCDDYLTKPFEMRELIARCKAMVRRAYDRPNPLLQVGDLTVDTTSRVVTFQGQSVLLPAMEYRLLEYLVIRAGQIVSKEEIIDHLYDFHSETFSNTVEVYISSLRRKIDPGPQHVLIHTIRGRGYLIGETSK